MKHKAVRLRWCGMNYSSSKYGS